MSVGPGGGADVPLAAPLPGTATYPPVRKALAMTTAAPLPVYSAAALRARTIAGIARARAVRRSAASSAGDVLRTIADHLDVAARSFETDLIPFRDGIPSAAWVALVHAEDLAASHPGIGFPPRFGQYITQPVAGTDIDLPALLGHPVLSVGETGLILPVKAVNWLLAQLWSLLVAWLRIVHDLLAATSSQTDTALCLRAVFALHRKHMWIADTVRAHNSRP